MTPPRRKTRSRSLTLSAVQPTEPTEALFKETYARFWRDTRYKPGQKLSLSDAQDWKMHKVWMDIFQQVQREADENRSKSKSKSKDKIEIGQIVRDRSRAALKGAAIVVSTAKHPGQFRICRWRGGQQHWSLPIAVGAEQLEPIADWTQIPLTEAKRLAAAAFERNYLVHAMESAKGSLADAALVAGIDRSNFRRLLQRHHLFKMPVPKRKRRRKAK